MEIKKKIILFLFINIILNYSLIAEENIVYIEFKGPDEVQVGSLFNVTVNVDDIKDFDAANFDIHFNETLVSVNSVSEGVINGTTVPTSMWRLIDNNTIRIVINMPGVTGINGNGTLAQINFTAIKAGNLLITASDAVFSNTFPEEIPTTWSSYNINVTADNDDTPAGAGGGNGNGDSGPTNSTDEINQLPIALCNTDVTTATIGQQIIFNGTSSFDNDGHIISYHWDFGDNTTSTLSTVTHSYNKEGTYPVTLTVTDNDTARNTCQTNITILGKTQKLSSPVISGPTICSVGTVCNYTITTPGLINQSITYTITWNDTQLHTQKTDSMKSDEPYLFNITWTAAGKYSLLVTISANNSSTNSTKLLILVDSILLKDIGYLIDTDTNGIYDTFQDLLSSETKRIIYEDERYLIDSNFDGQLDYSYSIKSGLQIFEEKQIKDTGHSQLLILIFCLLCIVVIKKKIDI